MTLTSPELRYAQFVPSLNYSGKNILRMNLNENIVMPLARLRSAISKVADQFDPRCYTSGLGEWEVGQLVKEIARYANCSSSSIGIGFGSDQILDLIFKSKFNGKRSTMVTVDPSYGMYAVLAGRLGAKVTFSKLNPSTANEPFALRSENVLKAVRKSGAKVLVLASPNNPTGIQYPLEQVRSILESLPDTSIVVDEAYVEYANYMTVSLLSKFRNLTVVRTFSKAFGLANLRLGYFLSCDSSFVEEFNVEAQYPYPVSGFAVSMATELLRRRSMVLEYVEKSKVYRKELMDSLQDLGFSVVPRPSANFVLVKSSVSKKIAEELFLKFAIAVKYIPRLGSEGEFLRITVGSREMNQRLLYSLRRIVL